MPINSVTGLFERIWTFLDQFASGDDARRADFDTAFDDVKDAINHTLGKTLTLETSTDDLWERSLALHQLLNNVPASDTTQVQNFIGDAESFTFSVIPPGVYSSGAVDVSDLQNAAFSSGGGSVIQREDSTNNLINLQSASSTTFADINLNGRYSTTGENGHGFVLDTPKIVSFNALRTIDFGGGAATNGGAGVVVFASDVNNLPQEVVVDRSRFTGATSDKSFGAILADSQFSRITNSFVQNASFWGLEYKDLAAFSIMANCIGSENGRSFGQGFEGPVGASNIIYSNLISTNSDIAFLASKGENILSNGVIYHHDTSPAFLGAISSYGLRTEDDLNNSVFLGTMATGTGMNFPVRIQGRNNFVELFDLSDSSFSVQLTANAENNHVVIGNVKDKDGNLVEDIAPLIQDQATSRPTFGEGANMFDCLSTRQKYGSKSGFYSWSLDAVGAAYAWFTTVRFRFMGPDGETVLGLSVKNGKRSGFRFFGETGQRGAIVYDRNDAGQDYIEVSVDDQQMLRIDDEQIAPVNNGLTNLGQSENPFGDTFLDRARVRPSINDLPIRNGDMSFRRVSDTQIDVIYRGLDGTLRISTLNFT